VNLQYQEVPKSSSDADKGKALAQDPAPQAQVKPATVVKVTVGTGLETVQVPNDLVGKSLDEATDLLTKAKLKVVSQEADGVEPLNQVKAMDPAPGSRVQEGTPVTLTVSNNLLMGMPNLINSSPDQAFGQLKDAGWGGESGDLGRSEVEVTDPGLVGAVVSQNPAPGNVVPKIGTAVQVQIGIPAKVDIPDVVGKPVAEARALMAGIPNVTFATVGGTPPGRAGTVQGQTVAGRVNVGTPVLVNVYGAEPPPTTPTTPPTTSAPPPSSAAPPGTTPPAGPPASVPNSPAPGG
jgi:beta-lactam-binding protein with PASTA domain